MTTENNISAEIEQLKQERRLLFRAVRISLGLMVSILGIACVRATFAIPKLRDVLEGLGAKLLGFTAFVMRHRDVLLLSAVTLTLVGLGFLIFSKNAGRCIIVATIIVIVLFAQWQATMSALWTPLVDLMDVAGGPHK